MAGAAKPLLRPAKVCPEIHGDSGLDGHDFPALPASSTPLPGKAVNVMAERIMASYAATGRKVVLVATGCLTNVALLLAVHPEVKDALQRIVIMGGAIGPGNTHPVVRVTECCALARRTLTLVFRWFFFGHALPHHAVSVNSTFKLTQKRPQWCSRLASMW